MTVRELAEEILADIAAGRLDPQAVVVRPLCMCDESVGYVEAQFVDQVTRRWQVANPKLGDDRIYGFGNVEPAGDTAVTVKLG